MIWKIPLSQISLHLKHTIFTTFEEKIKRHTGIPGLWMQELDFGLWTLDSGCWTLDAGLWMLHAEPRRLTLDTKFWTLDAQLRVLDSWRWTLGSGHWTLSLTVLEQNQQPVSDSALLNYWKFCRCESLRTSWSHLLYRGFRFWLGYF